MSASNFQAVMGLVLQHEGGFTNDRRDPGNWTGGKVGVGKLLGTKFGIAANTFPNLDIANITRGQAVEIYRRQYATPVRFDDLPAGVDYAVLDIAINSGTGKAGLILQGALAKLGQRVKVDGHVGDATVTAAAAVRASDLIDAVSDARHAYMKRLKNWPTLALVRMMALLTNGRWRRTPLLRALCAVLGAAVWGYVAMLMFQPALGGIQTGVGVYGVAALADVWSAWRSGRDIPVAERVHGWMRDNPPAPLPRGFAP